MSLINDALKRASTHKAAAPAPPGGPPLQPVESAPQTSGPLPIILCIVGIGALLMAGAFWLKSRGTPGVPLEQLVQEKPAGPPQVQLSTPEESRPAAADNPFERATAVLQNLEARNRAAESNQIVAVAPQPGTTPPLAPTSTPVAEPAKVQAAPAAVVEPVAQPAPAAPPSFRLQAIYFRMKGPTVVINGKTLKVGDSVDGAKLLAIGRTSAEIEFQGSQQKLTMH